MSTDHRTDAEQLWCLGYQYMIDSRRVGQQPRERAEDAQQAALLFAASQTRALVQVAERLAEIAEQLRISNAMTGTGHMGVLNSDAELRPARNAVRRMLGLPVIEGE
ncbi:hypothetical protein [Nocardia farcinica]|uniref:hypothetical protein n=1 Tax=Nocardia farcinica TaxID=37329 RepID=UPI002454B59E|nr:hypothetical protein [Nocardia farcinica]